MNELMGIKFLTQEFLKYVFLPLNTLISKLEKDYMYV